VMTGGHPTTMGAVVALSVAPDGMSVVSGGDDGSMVVWDLGSGQMVKRFVHSSRTVYGSKSILSM
jgi:WD40 repeat protein